MGSLEKGILVPKGRVKLTLKDPESKDTHRACSKVRSWSRVFSC